MAGEKNLENFLRKECEKHNVFERKAATPGNTGFPDRIIACKGKVIFIELKNSNGKGTLSQKQSLTIRTMKSHGLDVRVIETQKEVHDVIREIANAGTERGD